MEFVHFLFSLYLIFFVYLNLGAEAFVVLNKIRMGRVAREWWRTDSTQPRASARLSV